MSGVSRVSAGTNIFVSDTDSGIECALGDFPAHTSLGGAVGTRKGRDTSQGHLDMLERWASATLVEFSKAKCKVLTGAVAIPGTRTGWLEKWLTAALQRRTWG